jgi:uncharacterized protein YbjT (DUF2867 family)
MKVLIIGASGATGKDLLELLLQDNEIKRVDIFVRREINMIHDKLHIHIIDFEKPEQWKTLVTGNVLFSCLGTTRKAAGGKAAQWKIDYEYQYEFAKIAAENRVSNYVLVSAENASPISPIFYSKMKGQLEEAVKNLKFSTLIIFNPPLLIRKNSDRKMEIWSSRIINFINRLGILQSQKPMPTKLLAQAMIKSIKVLKNGVHALKGQHIKDFCINDNKAG